MTIKTSHIAIAAGLLLAVLLYRKKIAAAHVSQAGMLAEQEAVFKGSSFSDAIQAFDP